MNAQYRAEIERLYLELFDKLFCYAQSALANDALAEEAVQDTFHIACRKPEAVCGSPNPEGWIFNTLKNVISNTIRSQNAARHILLNYFADNISDITVATDRVGLEILYDDVAELEEFKLLKEMALEGRSHLEMAEERGISIAACRKRVERAKKTLQKKIKI